MLALAVLGAAGTATPAPANPDSRDYSRPGGDPATGQPLRGASASGAARNGRLPRRALARIYHPTYRLYLRRDAAAAWNTMRIYSRHVRGVDLYPGGALSAYRTYGEQVYAKRRYGSNAATPGRSNHGWGIAVDLATLKMRRTIDRIGEQFGWAKKWSDAAWEWWHLAWYSPAWEPRPDPGIDFRYPLAREGSGGPGQSWYVERLQELLAVTGYPISAYGEFDAETDAAVRQFQEQWGLEADGIVGARTWRALEKAAETVETTDPETG